MNKAKVLMPWPFLLLILCLPAYGQRPSEVVKWTAITTKVTSNSASVALSASINDGWHVYALSQPTGGPTPLRITVSVGSPFVLKAPVPEAAVTRHMDANFNMETVYYLNHVSFVIALQKQTDVQENAIPVDVRFQACNDRVCLPPYTAHLTAEPKRK
jgi:DsbC/DsbD-like thiol-disulfide interchange protein